MSDLGDRLNRQAATWAPDTLLRRMGYAKPEPKHRRRLARGLADPELGPSQADYDFVYGSRDFLRALGEALDVDPADVTAHIEALAAWRDRERCAYKPWLFVDTGFRRLDRPGFPIFALDLLESRRRLVLPQDTWELPWAAHLTRVQARVREHMIETGGELPVWGTIRRYLFCHAPHGKLALDTAGNVICDATGMGTDRAIVHLKGRPLFGIDSRP